MDPPDLLSVELSTSRPTQHLGRVKSKSPACPGFVSCPGRGTVVCERAEPAALARGQLGQGCRGTAVPRLPLAVGWEMRGGCIRRGGHLRPVSCVGRPASASLLPPPRRAQMLALLTPPNPAVLSRAKTTPRASRWPGAPSISRILCLSLRNTVFPILPPHCFPLLLGSYVHAPLFTALSLSLFTLCPLVWLSSLPCPLSVPLCSFYSPHGLSCRGASTSPTSACHLRSE